MMPAITLNRICAASIVICLTAMIVAISVMLSNLMGVAALSQAFPPLSSPPSAPRNSWTIPEPAIDIRGGDPRSRIGELLNVALVDLGLSIRRVDVGTIRPLGDGLRLAEVRIVASGEAGALGPLVDWIAVNRDTIRLQTISATRPADPSIDANGEVRLSLLMVIS